MNTSAKAHAIGEFPPGYKGARGMILVELKRQPGQTAKDLAARLALSLNAVRHHLKELEAEAAVEYERVHRGVGAPGFAYRLTPSGEGLFPRRYEETLQGVLDQVVERQGRGAAVALLEAQFSRLRDRLKDELAGAEPADRMVAVARALADEGYMAEGQATSCCGTLVEHNCAIRGVAQRFPEICAAEERFLSEVLGATVERRSHILAGCGACEYKVRFRAGTQAGRHD